MWDAAEDISRWRSTIVEILQKMTHDDDDELTEFKLFIANLGNSPIHNT